VVTPAHHPDDYDPVESVRLGTALVDLLDAAMATGLDGDQVLPVGTHQRVLLRQIYAFIDQHLGDPDLSPAGVAAAHHISLRYLHKLFETERATVAGWIRQDTGRPCTYAGLRHEAGAYQHAGDERRFRCIHGRSRCDPIPLIGPRPVGSALNMAAGRCRHIALKEGS